ncbi:serine--tRNA ligase [Candidatus Beckwithbacteria bacterium CG10_big_fil_rev_8_21_14_0_10_34_10]|uniref:Serine--tRNA ligase n=1 Tax=Candidatus Beckwithbacteria bacterium CG10_big_fil_rev_8_21_14_0_10_34_10 TaxID=1974495 RepID=A0A2H0WBI7_9BACT|nr:MAG: serine--tRNA ligase [Candidatus Beckwithbacteria bacterium CG10_big_fil_rev_8_21_14_0_10_34_10]
MLDLKFIYENKDKIKEACLQKGAEVKVVDEVLNLDKQRKELLSVVEELRQGRNKLGKDQLKKGKEIKLKLKKLEPKLREVEEKLNTFLLYIPNLPAADVPKGDKPKVVKTWGKKPRFNYPIKDHISLGTDLDLIDFKRGSKVGGFRSYFLKNELTLIHLGLIDWVFKKAIKKGFLPFCAPVVLKKEAFFSTGHFPWGEKEAYKLDNDLYLAGTSEVPMVSYHAGETLELKDLPLKYCAFSPCFRREIGNYGKDTKGIYRLHEFLKIELIVICEADKDKSEKWLEELRDISEEILKELKLPFRVLLMPTGDMGEPQYKKYDLEAWMPGRKAYGELMSDSNMLDFQSRRAKIKYRNEKEESVFVYTLNNTAISSPRTLIAILENYQQKDGSVKVPKVLQKYVGKKVIKRKF